MEHPTWDDLVARADGRGPALRDDPLASHLETCADCARDAAWLRQTVTLLGGETLPVPPPAARRAVDAAFEQRFRPAATTRPTVAAVRPVPAPRRRWYVAPVVSWGAATLAAMVVVAFFLWRSQPTTFVASVAEFGGQVEVGAAGVAGRGPALNEPLAAGDWVTTGDDGQATLDFGNGSARVNLSSHCGVQVEQIRLADGRLDHLTIRLRKGEAEATMRGPGGLELALPNANLYVRRGVVRAQALDDGRATVAVQSGQVEVTNAAGATTLQAGESLILYPGIEPGLSQPTPATLPTQGTAPDAASSPPETALPTAEPTATPSPDATARPPLLPLPSASPSPDESGGNRGGLDDGSGNFGSGSDESGGNSGGSDDGSSPGDGGPGSDDAGGDDNSGSGSDDASGEDSGGNSGGSDDNPGSGSNNSGGDDGDGDDSGGDSDNSGPGNSGGDDSGGDASDNSGSGNSGGGDGGADDD